MSYESLYFIKDELFPNYTFKKLCRLGQSLVPHSNFFNLKSKELLTIIQD